MARPHIPSGIFWSAALNRYQAVLQLIVGAIEDQIRATMRVEPPTAHIETDAALGLITATVRNGLIDRVRPSERRVDMAIS